MVEANSNLQAQRLELEVAVLQVLLCSIPTGAAQSPIGPLNQSVLWFLHKSVAQPAVCHTKTPACTSNRSQGTACTDCSSSICLLARSALLAVLLVACCLIAVLLVACCLLAVLLLGLLWLGSLQLRHLAEAFSGSGLSWQQPPPAAACAA